MQDASGTEDRATRFWNTDLKDLEEILGVDDVIALPIANDLRVPGQGSVLFDRVDRSSPDD
jgi:hypothetical protein